MNRGNIGFSLIEILVVITIIGLLIAASGGAYMRYVTYTESVATSAFIKELEAYAAAYNNNRGDYPPSTLKELGVATTSDEDNEGIEAFVVALYHKDYLGRRPDSTDNFINADDDEADKNLTKFPNPGLREFKDAWGNPLIYIRHSDYHKRFTATITGDEYGKESVDVYALKNPDTGTFYKFESCQILSVGPDNEFDTEDDVANFDRIDESDDF